MKKKELTFGTVIRELSKAQNYEEEYGLDYFSGVDELEPMPYDDYYAITTFGANEGIYTDFYVFREANGEKKRIAVAKTLDESEEAYYKMHELAAKVSLTLRKMSVESN